MDRPEYNSTATNAHSCYSNIILYGAEGKVSKIVAPTPVTTQPALFNIFKPHAMPQHSIPQQNFARKPESCSGYKSLNSYY
jgi:hypothetical protein